MLEISRKSYLGTINSFMSAKILQTCVISHSHLNAVLNYTNTQKQYTTLKNLVLTIKQTI